MIHPDRCKDHRLVDRITEMVTRRSVSQFRKQIRALLGRSDRNALLPSITCPTLVACGRQDGWATLAQNESIASAIPGATFQVIENSGHMVTMEQPKIVTKLLETWFARR